MHPQDLTASLVIGGLALSFSIVALVMCFGLMYLQEKNIQTWKAQVALNASMEKAITEISK